MVDKIYNFFQEQWHINPDLLLKMFYTVVAIIVLMIIRFLALKLIFAKFEQAKNRYMWKNGIKNAYYIILILILLNIWIDQIDSLGTFFGLIGAGLAIALQVPIVNLAGWLFIALRRPFDVGDRIEISGVAGDVIDIRFFQFTLNEIGNWVAADQSTGRIIHVPNGDVFKTSLANYSQGFSHIWVEMPVKLTFESNWRKAKTILGEIISKHAEELSFSAKRKLLEASKQYMIIYKNLTPIIYTSVKENGVELTLRFLSEPKKRRAKENAVWEDILETFQQHDDIVFAYPTQRIFYNHTEGKEGAKKL